MVHHHSPSMKTPLGRIRGLGSAKNGTHHWWRQRVTALALVFLGLWFLWFIVEHTSQGYISLAIALKKPLDAILMSLTIVTALHHAQLGLQVIIEDYVHCNTVKTCLLLGVKALAILLGAWGLLSILTIFFKAY